MIFIYFLFMVYSVVMGIFFMGIIGFMLYEALLPIYKKWRGKHG